MSGLKTFVFCGFLSGLLGLPALASPFDLTISMAGCAGRFSAELEHAWLMRDAQSAALKDQRAEFLAILDAITSPETKTAVLAHRIETKKAHAQLLSLATFGGDTRRSAWAKRQSQHLKKSCAEKLLKG